MKITAEGKLRGRVIAEGNAGGTTPEATLRHAARPAAADGLATYLSYQEVAGHAVFDAAGAFRTGRLAFTCEDDQDGLASR